MPNKNKSKKQQKQQKKEEISSCGLCTAADNDEMVQCDQCDVWYHFDCVNLTSITEEESWICPSCTDVQNTILARQISIRSLEAVNGNQNNLRSTIEPSNLHHDSGQANAEGTNSRTLQQTVNASTGLGSDNNLFENRLRSNVIENRPTFGYQRLDRHIVTEHFLPPVASQDVFMAQRQFYQFSAPPRFIHSTPTQGLNRQSMARQQPLDQREENPVFGLNRFSRPSNQREENPVSGLNHSSPQSIHSTEREERNSKNEQSVHQQIPRRDHRWNPRASSFRPESASSVKSSIQTQSTSRRIQIELQKLEEEKRACDEYINRKYRILLQERVKNKSTDRRSFTEDWVNDVSSERYDDFEDAESVHLTNQPYRSGEHPLKPTEVKVENKPSKRNEFDGQCPVKEINFKSPCEVNRDIGVGSLNQQNQPQVLNKNQIAARHVVTRDLPTFDGNPEDWPLFYSRFRNSTELCGYSNAENLDRLQKCLKGRALEAVRHRLLLPESLPQVIVTLQMLFGRPEFIVKHLINKVSKLSPPKMDKLDSIVDFAMSVQNVSATIESADLHQHLSNPALITELVNKIPVHLRLDWARFKVSQPTVTLATLANWLYSLAEVVATVTEPTFSSSDDKNKNAKKSSENQKKKPEYFNVHQESSSVDVQQKSKGEKESDSKSRQNQQKRCIICQKNCPSVAECNVFKSNEISQRWKLVNNKKLCRTCLRLHFGFCRRSKSCGINECNRKHHPLLHDEQRINEKSNDKKSNDKKSVDRKESSVAEANNVHFKINANVLLRIVPIKLFGVGRSLTTFAFVDDGSSTTLIDRRIADKLNFKGEPKKLCLLWSGKIHRTEKNSIEIGNVGISSIDKNSIQYQLKGVKTVDNLGIPAQRLSKSELCQRFPYLRDVPFEDYEEGLPGILIGSNNPKIGIPLEVIEGTDSEPIASRTRIGWTVHGPMNKMDSVNDESYPINSHLVEECSCDRDHDNNLHQYVKDYFSVENFGVRINNFMNKDSKDNERAMEQLKSFTRKIDNGYESGLLWRYDQFKLPDSYSMALRRLQCLENRHPKMIEAINGTIEDYIAKGYVTKLSKAEIQQFSPRVWYLPIFAVTNPKKPNKVRTVFDAAAKVKGVSLNSMLLKGPDQLVSLIDILRRFREKLIAATGDIREMYHQIKTRAEDKNCQRFLWRNGENREPDIYVMNVMTFGATCSPSIAHFVKNFNASKFAKEFPQAVETISKNHYVDDMMENEDTEEGMIKLINEVKMIHAEGGFQIRNFLSNSKAVMEAVGNDDGSMEKNKSIVPEKDMNIERVLGMWWNIDTDCFTFSLKFSALNKEILDGTKLPTKRELLRLLMSIFDPLGLISHFLVHLKIIIQEIWRSNLHWDQQISDSKILKLWIRWLNLLPKVEDIQVPRLYTAKLSPNTSTTVELHIFMDASEEAFGAVCYLRVEDENGVDCSLVGSKSRVAPIKYLSIPRKELQAALLGTRLSSSIVSSQTFKISRKVFWSDSKTILSWIRSDHRKYHQFVAHRIGEILENTEQTDWCWIPSKLNVADEMTKWAKPPSFEMSSRWFTGPDFLKLSEEKWPKQVEIEETNEEIKLHFAHSEISAPCLLDTSRFSNWNRMVRAMAYVIRYISILKAKLQKKSFIRGHLTQEELVRARNIIFQQAQFEEYPEEIILLTLNKNRSPEQQKFIDKSSSLYQCSPYLDENGILRIRGRTDLAECIQQNAKRPIILPRKNQITKLLMKCYHRMYHHQNNETVVNELRQSYYIPRLRVVLKSVIKNECQVCKIRKAKPEVPEMGRLPVGRLAVGFRPFTHTGVDLFGPMEVVVGKRVEKRWGSLFTCLTIRAVYIEVAHSLNTESFIKCLRNFINNRGRPTEMYSDCGSNFVGADSELTRAIKEIDLDKVATEFTTSYSKWNFNPPHAPHMGGVWERLVRSVKSSLYEVLPTRRPDDETLRSLLMEIQNVINSRPLTFIPLETDNDEALTPNHFVLGSSNGIKPPGVFESNGPFLRSAWRENQRITDLFWKRFIKEYIPTLTRRTKWFQPVKPLEIGDIAIDLNEKNVRNCYPKVRIIDRKIGSAGQVRKVRVQYANKSILWRPATVVARLDVLSTDGLTAAAPSSETEGSVTKGIRSSARIAKKKVTGTDSK